MYPIGSVSLFPSGDQLKVFSIGFKEENIHVFFLKRRTSRYPHHSVILMVLYLSFCSKSTRKRNSGYRSIDCKSPSSPPRFFVLNKAGLFNAYRESEKSTNLSFLEVIRVNCTKTTKIISLTI